MGRARYAEQHPTYRAEWRTDGVSHGRGATPVDTSTSAYGITITFPSGRAVTLLRAPVIVACDQFQAHARRIIEVLRRASAGAVTRAFLDDYTFTLGRGKRGGGYHRRYGRRIVVHPIVGRGGFDLGTLGHELAHALEDSIPGHSASNAHGREFRTCALILRVAAIGGCQTLADEFRAAGLLWQRREEMCAAVGDLWDALVVPHLDAPTNGRIASAVAAQ